jgi:hypothetical protein
MRRKSSEFNQLLDLVENLPLCWQVEQFLRQWEWCVVATDSSDGCF